ncbi:MAG: hypothetical protein R3249_09550 [Nitriliruptorales bacterium]|nr:hypothetical protein [Nitriliruptorales bacterium]
MALTAIVSVLVVILAHDIYGREWDLASVEGRWNEAGILTYSMELQVCPSYMCEHWKVAVDGGRVEAEAIAAEPWSQPPTVDVLLAAARSFLREYDGLLPWRRVTVEIEVNGDGVPVSAFLDGPGIEEEYSWHIDVFETRAP